MYTEIIKTVLNKYTFQFTMSVASLLLQAGPCRFQKIDTKKDDNRPTTTTLDNRTMDVEGDGHLQNTMVAPVDRGRFGGDIYQGKVSWQPEDIVERVRVR